MISLAGRDILHGWSKFVLTGVGLGLLIGVTLTMAGVYRGMVDDANALLDNSGADLWVVQKGTLGPYAESSSIYDDEWRSVRSISGVQHASSVTYFTMQVQHGERDVRAMVAGINYGELGSTGMPDYLISGRQITRSHYEAVADVSSGFKLGDKLLIRRSNYVVVGLTRRMVSSNGDPIIFIPLKDAQNAQFMKDNEAIWLQRRRTAADSELSNERAPGVLDALLDAQSKNPYVNAVMVRVEEGRSHDEVANNIRKSKSLTVFTRGEMEAILVGKLIATAAKQIGLFLVILTVVSAAIVAFIIYTMTLGKIREIAVLKLIGTRNSTIAAMIVQQAVALGMIGFVVGKIAATFASPHFPKYVLLKPMDSVIGFGTVLGFCVLASIVAIRAALKVDPAEAIGG